MSPPPPPTPVSVATYTASPLARQGPVSGRGSCRQNTDQLSTHRPLYELCLISDMYLIKWPLLWQTCCAALQSFLGDSSSCCLSVAAEQSARHDLWPLTSTTLFSRSFSVKSKWLAAMCRRPMSSLWLCGTNNHVHQSPFSPLPSALGGSLWPSRRAASTASAVLNVLTCCLCDWTIYPVKECIMWTKTPNKTYIWNAAVFLFCLLPGDRRVSSCCLLSLC